MKNLMVFVIIVAALALPRRAAHGADTYKLDPAHTSVCFYFRHLGICSIPGRFNEIAGAVVLDGNSLKEITATIQVRSVDTGIAQRDNHLRTADFFDEAKYPVITLTTKRMEKEGEQLVAFGDLTMHGVTKELRLPVTLHGPFMDPWGNVRIGLEAKAKLNRRDFGINYNQVLEGGIQAVGEEVEISLNAEATRAAGEKTPSAK